MQDSTFSLDLKLYFIVNYKENTSRDQRLKIMADRISQGKRK